jgi:FMN-binding domain
MLMRRPALFAAGAGTGLVLTVAGLSLSQASHQAPTAPAGIVTAPAVTGGTTSGAGAAGAGAAGAGAAGAGAATPPAATHGSTGAGTLVINGAAASTQYGTVQVQITVTNHRIVSATALTLPAGGRSSSISAYAAPILRQETLTAQSATIDAVSGASYTSSGWQASLQSALNTARTHGA